MEDKQKNELKMKTFEFIDTALKAFEDGGREHDKVYHFKCPSCGGNAIVVASPLNGHRYAKCEQCAMGFIE